MKWTIANKISKDFIGQFPEYHPVILQLLSNRGIFTREDMDVFFKGNYMKDLYDSFLMLGMDKLTERILRASRDKEKVIVFGDYDCDGVCGAAILESVFKVIGIKEVHVYIPDRQTEGYSLNKSAIEKFVEEGVGLLVTVDCGISDEEEIKFANELGMDVLVVDHHRLSGNLPPALAIVDPHQPGCQYPFKYLAGAGVAFKVACALITKAKESSGMNLKIVEGWEKWLLDLAALATVADCMLLTGENRIIVKYGLIVLSKTKRLGLKKLMEIAGTDPAKLDVFSLSFALAPRLNAAGRMDHANMAYELIISGDPEEAEWIARRLDELNKERQQIVEKIIREVDAKISGGGPVGNFIMEGSADWSKGVVGIAAGKLAEKYWRPSFIYCRDEEESVGSARSKGGINLVEVFQKCSRFLKAFGGHAEAAGFTFINENFENFHSCLAECLKDAVFKEKELEIECIIEERDIDWPLFRELEKMFPFGFGNPSPVFLAKNLVVRDIAKVGNGGNHLKLKLGNNFIGSIGFGLGGWFEKLAVGDKIDVVGEIIVNEWNGLKKLELKIIDLKLSENN